MSRRLLVFTIGLAVICGTAGAITAVVTHAGPVMSDPPSWVKELVANEVSWCGSPHVVSAVWVQTDYASAEARLDGQAGGQGTMEYLIVLTTDSQFVGINQFYPVGAQAPRGKYLILLANNSHGRPEVDTISIGDNPVDMNGLGQLAEWSVN